MTVKDAASSICDGPNLPNAAGILFIRVNPETGKVEVLLAKRTKNPCMILSGMTSPGKWSVLGGSVDGDDQTVEDAQVREVLEETGEKVRINPDDIHQIYLYTNPVTGKTYQTGIVVVDDLDISNGDLCAEHDECRWFALELPSQLHPGLAALLEDPAVQSYLMTYQLAAMAEVADKAMKAPSLNS